MMNTNFASDVFFPALNSAGIPSAEFRTCLTLYLAMEAWFHQNNSKRDVQNVKPFIAYIIDMLKRCFPRTDGNQWKLPKMHGLTRISESMQDYGNAKNFFGGVGEHNHISFVKRTGNNTQKRVGSFSSQVAKRWFESYAIRLSRSFASRRSSSVMFKLVGVKRGDAPAYNKYFAGRYHLLIKEEMDNGRPEYRTSVWHRRKVDRKVTLRPTLLFAILEHAYSCGETLPPLSLAAFTSMQKTFHGTNVTFRFTENWWDGGSWHDWCLLDFTGIFEERNKVGHFPAQILGAYTFDLTDDNCDRAFVLCKVARYPVTLDDLRKNFFVNVEMDPTDPEEYCTDDIYVVGRDQVISPLLIIPNFGDLSHLYKCILPQRYWGEFFSSRLSVFMNTGKVNNI